jgi:tetratricopeptide (TPR) repeat protein
MATWKMLIVAGAAALILAPLASLPARALGTDTDTPTCPKGRIWDGQTKKCVVKASKAVPDADRADYAYALAKAGRYQEALDVLDTLQNPRTAEALNYRGYATRKLGRTDEGIGYYLQSVKLDPNYAKVREYLGEAYVIKGRLDLAREQLQRIEAICGGTACEEYEDLADAVAHPAKI